MPDTDDAVVASGGNVFQDLGLPNAEERLAKATLALQIAEAVSDRGLSQSQAAQILGTTQPKVSDLFRGRLAGFSMERLIRFLNLLDRDVEILISPTPRSRERGSLRVETRGSST